MKHHERQQVYRLQLPPPRDESAPLRRMTTLQFLLAPKEHLPHELLQAQSRRYGASPTLQRHAAWAVVDRSSQVSGNLLAAGLSTSGALVVVTDEATYCVVQGWSSFKIHSLAHHTTNSLRHVGMWSPVLRLVQANGRFLDVPKTVDQTQYPVEEVIVGVHGGLKWEARVRAIVEPHVQALSRRRSQLLLTDDYGVEDRHHWDREITHFYERVFLPALPADLEWPDKIYLAGSFQSWVELIIEEHLQTRPSTTTSSERATSTPSTWSGPADFEAYCSARLTEAGWRTRLTPRTGDQGVDVIAEAPGFRLVLQCKLYSSPVGNKAVQEILAGKGFQEATHGAVITNSSYTASARSLARKTGIYLLHVTELTSFARDLLAGRVGKKK